MPKGIKHPKKKTKTEACLTAYTHPSENRTNNPPVGLVTAETDHLNGVKKYEYDPHLDPQLQWTGKKEGIIA